MTARPNCGIWENVCSSTKKMMKFFGIPISAGEYDAWKEKIVNRINVEHRAVFNIQDLKSLFFKTQKEESLEIAHEFWEALLDVCSESVEEEIDKGPARSVVHAFSFPMQVHDYKNKSQSESKEYIKIAENFTCKDSLGGGDHVVCKALYTKFSSGEPVSLITSEMKKQWTNEQKCFYSNEISNSDQYNVDLSLGNIFNTNQSAKGSQDENSEPELHKQKSGPSSVSEQEKPCCSKNLQPCASSTSKDNHELGEQSSGHVTETTQTISNSEKESKKTEDITIKEETVISQPVKKENGNTEGKSFHEKQSSEGGHLHYIQNVESESHGQSTEKCQQLESRNTQLTEECQQSASSHAQLKEKSKQSENSHAQSTEKCQHSESSQNQSTEKTQQSENCQTEKFQQSKSSQTQSTEKSQQSENSQTQSTEKCQQSESSQIQSTEKSQQSENNQTRSTEKCQKSKSSQTQSTEKSQQSENSHTQSTEKCQLSESSQTQLREKFQQSENSQSHSTEQQLQKSESNQTQLTDNQIEDDSQVEQETVIRSGLSGEENDNKAMEDVKQDNVDDVRLNSLDNEETKSSSACRQESNIPFVEKSFTDLEAETLKSSNKLLKGGESDACLNHEVKILDMLENEIDQQSQHLLEKESVTANDLVFGLEAHKNYSLYTEIEKKIKAKNLRKAKEAVVEKMKWRIAKIEEIIDVARAYYKNPSGKAAEDWRSLRNSIKSGSNTSVDSQTDIRYKLAQLHSHRPIFTAFVIIVQVAFIGIFCALGGLAEIGFEPKLELAKGIQTFLGKETIHKWKKPNVWIGPQDRYWIKMGALFAPCMREDFKLLIESSKQNYSTSAALGCCELANKNTAGTFTEEECQELTGGRGVWHSGVPCGERVPGSNNVAHVLKPCCINTRGECRMVSHKHCQFLEGVFHHSGKEHCSQVNCIDNICQMGGVRAKPAQPWLPDTPQQWWRLPLSLFYHHGIIHAVLVVGTEILWLRYIEGTMGWLRILIIYLVCGCGGLMAAVIFQPYQPHMGGTGALFGLIGLLFVELLQFWTVIKKPWYELVKLIIAMIIFLFSGTLPYLNIFTIITGFILGMLCAVVLLPYVTFERHRTVCRIVLLTISIPVLIFIFFVLFYIFYSVQTLDTCKFCEVINCVPYTQNMCKGLGD